MSNLFMDMQPRRLQRVATRGSSLADSLVTSSNLSSDSSFISSFYANGEQESIASSKPTKNFMNNDGADNEEDAYDFSNMLNLKLKKPKHWKWELSTSRSCSNIALPRILLHDHKGNLLIDVNSQEESVYQEEKHKPQRRRSSSRKRSNRAATANLAHSINQSLDDDFDGLQIVEATPSLLSPISSTLNTRNSSPVTTNSCIDFYSNDLPDYKFERRSSSLKGVRFMVDEYQKPPSKDYAIDSLLTPPPSSSNTTPTTPTSSSSGPREKRRYRRSQSSGRSPNPPSILERFSYTKGRFSSPEFAEEHDVYRPPRYYLRTSRAGTLVVAEDSFRRYQRRRPRHKTSSMESVKSPPFNNVTEARSLSGSSNHVASAMNPLKQNRLMIPNNYSGSSLQNVASIAGDTKKKSLPVRRYRSDGNILLNQQLSSSEEEDLNTHRRNEGEAKRFSSLKRHIKSKDRLPIHPENGVFHDFGQATGR